MKPIRLIDARTKERAAEMVLKAPAEPVYEMVLRQAESLRSIEQNDKAHAMLTDISRQVDWHGSKLSVTVWKRVTTAAMLREIGEAPMLIPSIDGHGVEIIYEKTSKMGVRKMAMLIEFLYAFGSENNVRWSDPKDITNYMEGR